MDKSNFKKTGQYASQLKTKNKAGYNAITWGSPYRLIRKHFINRNCAVFSHEKL